MSKKAKLILILMVALLVIALVTFIIYKSISPTLKEIYESNWDLELPSTLKEEEKFCTPIDYHGDGLKYSLYIDKNKNNQYYDDFLDDSEKFAQNLIKNSIKKYLDKGIVVEGKYFDFSYGYKFKYMEQNIHDWIVMIWIPEYHKLIIMQETM